MKSKISPAASCLLLISTLGAVADPKTTTPEKIRPELITEAPYRFNGVVRTQTARGSGFCAWNRHTFFTAAHVVFDDAAGKWELPPYWFPQANSTDLVADDGILSRGYYRWTNYADLATDNGAKYSAFSRDVALAYSFKKLIKGTPAKVNLNGFNDLKENRPTMITGYPADNLYEDKDLTGYFLYKTGPVRTPYQTYSGHALTTTLVTTGHGNSGGPIWTKNANGKWNAAGVLVGGLPSESVVYSFTEDIRSLFAVVKPTLRPEIGMTDLRTTEIGASSQFFPCHQDQKIPDGQHSWTSFKINVDLPDRQAKVSTARISLDIRTKHRGDLQVVLQAPGGYQALIHNEGGADKNNLIIKDMDVTEAFEGILPRGPWYLLVQDRLKGDVATFKSCVLELSEDEQTETTPEP